MSKMAAQVPSSNVTANVPRSPARNSSMVAAFVSRIDSMITLPVESMTATEMVAWCTSSPIYFSVFIEGAPFVGEDVTITTYSKRGALL
jgi:hypothetical protein